MSGDIESINARLNIAEVVREYVPQLKPAGSKFKALCPFHKEKTPSFVVSPSKNMFYCFGCHKGGDMFTFIMEMEHSSFPEALQRLARKAGIRLSERVSARAALDSPLYSVQEWALSLYEKSLWGRDGSASQDGFVSTGAGDKEPLEYLRSRHVKEEFIKQFRLGWAPSGRSFLKDRLKEVSSTSGISWESLVKVGLARETGENFFYHRVLFPIMDAQGRVVAFGGRTMEEGVQPKYLNTPETALFNKRRVLYGLFQARESLIRHKRALIVEGYLDAILLHQNGFDYAVATLGTALTPEHLYLLKRYVEEIILVFDGDAAGQKAADRALETVVSEEVNTQVVVIPDNLDPADFVVQRGAEAFQTLLGTAQPILDFKYETLKKQFSGEALSSRLAFVDQWLRVLAGLHNPVLKEHYLDRCAEEMGQKRHILNARLLQIAVTSEGAVDSFQSAQGVSLSHEERGGFSPSSGFSEKEPLTPDRELDLQLLYALVKNNLLIPKFISQGGEEGFFLDSPEMRDACQYILTLYKDKGLVSLQDLYDSFYSGSLPSLEEGGQRPGIFSLLLRMFSQWEVREEESAEAYTLERFEKLLTFKKKKNLEKKTEEFRRQRTSRSLSQEELKEYETLQRRRKQGENFEESRSPEVEGPRSGGV